MEITQERLQERLAMLQKQFQEAMNHAQAINGAIQDTQYWLEQLSLSKEPSLGPQLVKE